MLSRHRSLVTFSLYVILAINRPDITDTEVETVMDTIVDSLFCFFVTLGKFKIFNIPLGKFQIHF